MRLPTISWRTAGNLFLRPGHLDVSSSAASRRSPTTFSTAGWFGLLTSNDHAPMRLLPWLIAYLPVIPHLPKLCLYRIVDGSAFPSYRPKSPVLRGPLGQWIRGCRTVDKVRGSGQSN